MPHSCIGSPSFSLQPLVSHLEVVDLQEGFVRVEGMFNCRGARLTDLTGFLHVRSAGGQIEHRNNNTDGKIRQGEDSLEGAHNYSGRYCRKTKTEWYRVREPGRFCISSDSNLSSRNIQILVLSVVNTIVAIILPKAAKETSCGFIIACYGVYMTSRCCTLTLPPMTHWAIK